MTAPSTQTESRPQAVELCSFCEEVLGPQEVTLPLVRTFFDEFGQTSRTLLETRELFVVPSLGALMLGHLLVLPRSHYYSIGEMPETELNECEALVQASKTVLSQTYGSCSAFEHGCVEGVGKAGACIDHAHLHLIPLSKDLEPLIERRFGRGIEVRRLSELRQFVSRGIPYLYYQGPGGLARAYEAPKAPSQFFRQLVFAATEGVADWDWKRDLRIATVKETHESLKMAFAGLEKQIGSVGSQGSQESSPSSPSDLIALPFWPNDLPEDESTRRQ